MSSWGGNAGAAPTIYLFRIALKTVSPKATPDQVAQMQRLNEAKNVRELMDYVISLVPGAAASAGRSTSRTGPSRLKTC